MSAIETSSVPLFLGRIFRELAKDYEERSKIAASSEYKPVPKCR